MKKITLFTILLFTIFSCSSISPSNLNYFSKKTGGNVQNTREQMDGIASWYGPNFHNKKTANGEIYNQNAYTVAHRILPLGSIIKITNLENSKKIYARVNDRGPYKKKRIVDVSKKIATELGFIDKGTARVKLDIISYPKKYDKARGITPYKQKVVQIVAYSQKSYAVRGALKLKQELYPIPVFIDQPKTDVFYVLTGPFNSSDKATQVSQRINIRPTLKTRPCPVFNVLQREYYRRQTFLLSVFFCLFFYLKKTSLFLLFVFFRKKSSKKISL